MKPIHRSRINTAYKHQTQNPVAFQTELQNYIKAVLCTLMKANTINFDLEDLVQDAFIRVHTKIGLFEGRSAFSSWLYALLRNFFLDEVRKIRSRNEVGLSEWKDYDGEYASSSNARRNMDGNFDIDGSFGCEDVNNSAEGAAPLLSKAEMTSSEDERFRRIEFQRFETGLAEEDRRILDGIILGEKPRETAKRLGMNIRAVNYRTALIKTQACEVLGEPLRTARKARNKIGKTPEVNRLSIEQRQQPSSLEAVHTNVRIPDVSDPPSRGFF